MSLPYLKDSYDRVHRTLRISLTQVCQIACSYCRPKSSLSAKHDSFKSISNPNDIYHLTRRMILECSFNKVKITGGEPLMSPIFDEYMNLILKDKSLAEIESGFHLGISTNGLLIHRHIDTFNKIPKQFGSINISVDTLCSKTYMDITGVNGLPKLLSNLQLLVESDYHRHNQNKIKINCVLLKSLPIENFYSVLMLARDLPIEIKFIEFMPFEDNQWSNDSLYRSDEIMKYFTDCRNEVPAVIEISDKSRPVQKLYTFQKWSGCFGFISSVSNPFCSSCDRVRLLPDNTIQLCLFDRNQYSIDPLADDLRSEIQEVLLKKPSGGINSTALARPMYKIGG